MSTKRGGQDPVLLGLRQADCVLARAARIGGPRRWHSALADRNGGDDLDPADIEAALTQIDAVQRIADPKVRRVVAEALVTNGCREIRTVRQIAEAARVPRSSVQRLLRVGLEALKRDFDRLEAA
jgi:hypothetical protein